MGDQSGTTARLSRLVLRALFGVTMLVVIHWNEAQAQSVRIVAFGASNTAGWGVGKGAAWPAHLERLLKARSIAATVHNVGISGNSSRDLLARLDSAVPTGVQLVVLHANGYNDRRKGQLGEFAANVAQIKTRLAARNIKVVHLPGDLFGLIKSHPQPDGIHLTSEGHAKLAARVLPEVLSALGRSVELLPIEAGGGKEAPSAVAQRPSTQRLPSASEGSVPPKDAGQFDGVWQLHRESTNCGLKNWTVTITVRDGAATGAMPAGPIVGTVSEPGQLVLKHSGMTLGRPDGSTLQYNGLLQGSSGSGTFYQNPQCSGTFTFKRTANF